ncbi:TetR/AcrR family transcriptional regulator [Loigolactobacillus backii]|uniref:TetR/AcrR family transcriptional regulator n=2 Tax=Lactobacillaceae TaxID=33958 RepID=UPI000F7E383E|nr:TetR/AcrR family transcriptional regulator [Loigolactobacillus backii]MDA5388918.1 TetR/AcrR family transcriptional regulator [Loigolactobacillus backii]
MKKRDITKEERILNATAQIIINEGAAAVSTTKVAKKVNIAQSNIYLYFKDKRTLLSSVYRRELEKVVATTDMAQITDSELPLRQRLRTYTRSIYDFALANPDSLTVIEQIKSLRGQGQAYIDDAMKIANPVTVLLNAGIKAGILRPTHVSLHMTAVFSIVQRHVQNIKNGIYPADKFTYEDISAMIWGAIGTD